MKSDKDKCVQIVQRFRKQCRISLSSSADSPNVAALKCYSVLFFGFAPCCFRIYSKGLATTTNVFELVKKNDAFSSRMFGPV